MRKLIEKWILQLCHKESSTNDIVALNFGIFETERGYSLYLIGSKQYDEHDDDWACYVDYEPTSKYLEITCDRITDWKSFMDEAMMIISDIIKTPSVSNSSLFSGKIITIGFDDGPLERIR